MTEQTKLSMGQRKGIEKVLQYRYERVIRARDIQRELRKEEIKEEAYAFAKEQTGVEHRMKALMEVCQALDKTGLVRSEGEPPLASAHSLQYSRSDTPAGVAYCRRQKELLQEMEDLMPPIDHVLEDILLRLWTCETVDELGLDFSADLMQLEGSDA
jgi:hypothetical protein